MLNEVVFHVVHQLDAGLSAAQRPAAAPDRRGDDRRRHRPLARRAPLAFELTYFWALTATVQALLTPDLRQGFPDYRWWWFVIAHAGVVVAAVLPGLGAAPHPAARRGAPRLRLEPRGDRPRRGRDARRSTATTCSCARSPAGGSLLDLMGPWPWYIVSAAALALALFWLLTAPSTDAGTARPAGHP